MDYSAGTKAGIANVSALMADGIDRQAPDDRAWLQKALTAGGIGIWEWDHQSGAIRLCPGAAMMLAGSAALAWTHLTFADALAAVHSEDITELRMQLHAAAYFSNLKFGPFRVCTRESGTRQILMRGQTALALNSTPSQTRGVMIDVTDVDLGGERGSLNVESDALNRAAHHSIAAYDAIQASKAICLLAPARALMFAIGREIARRVSVGGRRPH